MSLLADIAILRTYSAMKSNGKKETWQEVVDRYRQCLLDQTPRFLHDDIAQACKLVEAKVVLPSMRFLQFAGEGIRRENVRGYNCSFTPVDSVRAFSEIFYILMCGTGVGYSVQRHHINQLPRIQAGSAEELYVVQDSKEGWADSIAKLVQNPDVRFDYSQVRPAGALLSTGGTASGPESLVRAHGNVRRILRAATGRKLRSLEVHDVVCHIADVVVVGGVRRAALISLFDRDDSEMLACKSGQWWEQNPQRARANNSAVLPHGQVDYNEFSDILDRTYNSFSGEPGIFWTSDPENDMGTNPCCEIALNPNQFCNLTTINFAAVSSVGHFLKAVSAATRLGTIQASFTNFGYLSDRWKRQTEEEALLGVSLTGLAANAYKMQQFLAQNIFSSAARLAKDLNYYTAMDLGINPAARVTTIKPEGTTSTCLDTTSGIHSAHAPYYIRRIRIDKGQEIGQYLSTVLPPMFIEDDKFNPQNYVVSVPFAMPAAVTRQDETATAFLQNVFAMRREWVEPGHSVGWNKHNISCTVSYKEEERDTLKKLMWANRSAYNGISLLPYDGGTYVQAPFEEISEATYQEMKELLPDVDLYTVQYGEGKKDERVQVLACSGGQCELT
jgi:ribonucleoside-diphosphate reductase alpha chain